MAYSTSTEPKSEERYIEIPARLTLEELVATVETLPLAEMRAFTERVTAILRARQKAAILADDEERALLRRIESRLSPEAQARLDALRAKSRAGTLDAEEHAQLLDFVQQVERQDLARVEALIALAEKRGVSVSTLLHTLEIQAADVT